MPLSQFAVQGDFVFGIPTLLKRYSTVEPSYKKLLYNEILVITKRGSLTSEVLV